MSYLDQTKGRRIVGSAPKPPPTPNPFDTANAQQVANVEVAVANTFLQNADEVRPDGSVVYSDVLDGAGNPVTLDTHTYDADGLIVGTRTIKKVQKTVTLTTKGQQQFDAQQDIAIAMNVWASGQVAILDTQQGAPITADNLVARLTTPAAPTIDTSDVTTGALTETIGSTDLVGHFGDTRDALYAEEVEFIDVRKNNLIDDLVHQGLTAGMTAYDRVIDEYNREYGRAARSARIGAGQEQTRIVQTEGLVAEFHNKTVAQKLQQDITVIDFRNNVRTTAYQALVSAAEFVNVLRERQLQEMIAIRGNNINEISALLHGGKIETPRFQGYKAGAIAKTPVADSVYQSAALDMQKWRVQVQQQQSMMGGVLGMAGNLAGGMLAFSDKRLKTDVELVERDERGFGWYKYRYEWSDQLYIGVMAQELLQVMPEAVLTTPSGYLAVDYGGL